MKFAIMGSGGIGAYYGALLAKAGIETHFIARGDHLAAMRVAQFSGDTILRDPDL